MKKSRTILFVCALVLMVVRPGLAQNPFEAPPRPNGPYDIRGVVVDAQTGQPLSEVELSIQDSAQPTGPAFEVVQSEADGGFRFANLTEGKYSIHVSRQGYAEQAYLQHENFWTGIAAGPGKDSIHVRFPMNPSATIRGQVTDENGEAVRGASITLWSERMQNGVEAISRAENAVTDDEGRYRIGHLLPGKYSVSVQATPWYSRYNSPGGIPASDVLTNSNAGRFLSSAVSAALALPDVVYPVLYYPNARDWHDMDWLTVRAGGTENADLHLAAEPSVHLQVRVGPTGSAQPPNVALAIEFPGGGEGSAGGDAAISGSGVAEISGIAAGNYRLERTGGPGVDFVGEGQKIDLSGNAELNLDEAPTPKRSIHGVLRMDEGDLTIDQAVVQLKDPQGQTFGGMYFHASEDRADAKGGFAIENVPTGSQTFELSIAQPPDFLVKRIEAKGAKVNGTTIETDGIQEVSLIVTLEQFSTRIDGTAMKDGKGFGGAMVLLVPEDGKEMDRRVRRDQSDSDGTFRLSTVLPGKYLLMALEHGWEMEWSKAEVLRPFLAKGTRVEVREGQVRPVSVEVQ